MTDLKKDKKDTSEKVLSVLPPQALPGAAMYVGPSLVDPFPVAFGTVFTNGLPGPLQKAVSVDTDLAALFLPLVEAGAALRRLENGTDARLALHIKAVAAGQAARRT